MAKQQKKTAVKKNEDVNGALVKADFGDYAGMGWENQTSADMVIPFLGLLQTNSPQVEEGEQRIKGAKAGDMFNTVTQELIEGPVYIVPCCTQHVFVEWVPRVQGGGFVGVHELGSEVVSKAKTNATAFNELKTEAGNDLIETFYIYALLLEGPDSTESLSPIVLAFSSTKIKVYKRMMTQLRTVKANPQPPMFAYRLEVSSVGDKNKKGSFKNFSLSPVGNSLADSLNLPDSDYAGLLSEGRALVEAILGGHARAAHESQTSGTSNPDDGDEVF